MSLEAIALARADDEDMYPFLLRVLQSEASLEEKKKQIIPYLNSIPWQDCPLLTQLIVRLFEGNKGILNEIKYSQMESRRIPHREAYVDYGDWQQLVGSDGKVKAKLITE